MTNPNPKNPIPLKDRKLYQECQQALGTALGERRAKLPWFYSRIGLLCSSLRDAWAVALKAEFKLEHQWQACINGSTGERYRYCRKCVSENGLIYYTDKRHDLTPADWQAEPDRLLMEGE